MVHSCKLKFCNTTYISTVFSCDPMRSRSNPPALETFIGPFIIAEGGWREHALVGDRHGHDHLCAGLHAQEYVTISDSYCRHYSLTWYYLSLRFYLPLPAIEAMRVVSILYLIASLVSCVVVVQACRCECLLQDVCACGKPIDDLAHLQMFSCETS